MSTPLAFTSRILIFQWLIVVFIVVVPIIHFEVPIILPIFLRLTFGSNLTLTLHISLDLASLAPLLVPKPEIVPDLWAQSELL